MTWRASSRRTTKECATKVRAITGAQQMLGSGQRDGDTGGFSGRLAAVAPRPHTQQPRQGSLAPCGWALGSGKRLFDILSAGLGLALVAPLLLVAVAGVRLVMGLPILFRQQRLGLAGKPFVVFKLRTMDDAQISVDRLGATRLTPLGRILRRWSLDELPQLWNVLRGEMSLVGPRPLPLDYAGRYSARQRRRHDVKPGITGWAQVRGRNALNWERRFELDLWYVEHASLWLDLKILVRSFAVVLTGAGLTPRSAVLMPEFVGDQRDAA